MASIDWAKAKTTYVTSDKTIKEIADKFGVSERTVWRRYTKENWKQLRADYVSRLTERCQEKTLEKQAKSFAEFVPVLEQGIVDISTQLLGKINETMQFGDAFSPRDLKSLSSMVIDIGMLLKDIKEDMNTGSASADKITVEFVKGEWDYAGPES